MQMESGYTGIYLNDFPSSDSINANQTANTAQNDFVNTDGNISFNDMISAATIGNMNPSNNPNLGSSDYSTRYGVNRVSPSSSASALMSDTLDIASAAIQTENIHLYPFKKRKYVHSGHIIINPVAEVNPVPINIIHNIDIDDHRREPHIIPDSSDRYQDDSIFNLADDAHQAADMHHTDHSHDPTLDSIHNEEIPEIPKNSGKSVIMTCII